MAATNESLSIRPGQGCFYLPWWKLSTMTERTMPMVAGHFPHLPEIGQQPIRLNTETQESTRASPQLENGYTKVADEILEALARTQISGHGWRILMVVFRKTYGWDKKFDWIAYEQFIEMTGLKKQRVYEAFKELCERNILTRSGATVGFQKDYTKWKDSRQKRKSRKTVTVTEKHYARASCNRKPDNRNGKPGPQYTLIQQTKECGSPDGSPKKTDPRVREVIAHFLTECEEKKGFRPKVNGKDGAVVKAALKDMHPDDVRNCVTFFLGSKKADEVGVTLAAALSTHSVNLWRQQRAKTDWRQA